MTNNNYYPIFLNLRAKRILVIGGGNVAERKVETLLTFQAVIKVVAPEVNSRISELARKGEIELELRQFKITDLDGIFLAYICTSDNKLNSGISSAAREKGILVNVVDNAEESTFIVPAIFKRGDLLMGISTFGKSPALASYIKEKLEQVFGEEYAEFVQLLGDIRPKIIDNVNDQKVRKEIFFKLVHSDILSLLEKGHKEEALERMNMIIQVELEK